MVFICGLRSEKGVHTLIFLLLFWPSLASYPQKPFLAFTDVLEEMWREVTRKVLEFCQTGETADGADHADFRKGGLLITL